MQPHTLVCVQLASPLCLALRSFVHALVDWGWRMGGSVCPCVTTPTAAETSHAPFVSVFGWHLACFVHGHHPPIASLCAPSNHPRSRQTTVPMRSCTCTCLSHADACHVHAAAPRRTMLCPAPHGLPGAEQMPTQPWLCLRPVTVTATPLQDPHAPCPRSRPSPPLRRRNGRRRGGGRESRWVLSQGGSWVGRL